MEDLGEVGVLAHAVAAAADVDDMAVMQQAIDERSGHDLVAQDLSPLLEALVGRQHSGCALVAPVDELEEEHRAGLADGQVADLVDDQERGMGEDLEAASQLPERLSCPQSMTVLAGGMLHDGQLCSGSVGISGGSDLGPSRLRPSSGASSVIGHLHCERCHEPWA